MPLGIDPKVDFAFKLMLGSPEHPAVTIHFLNAILRLDVPVTDVTILNPIHEKKDRPDDKVVVLDILAKDSQGRRFNVEMQTTRQVDLPRRLLYYSSLTYGRQIREGQYYTDLRPVLSICVLDEIMFAKPAYPWYHHSFRLRCDQADLIFTNDLEFHILELPKFTPSSDNIGSLPAEEKWLYLLRHADTMDADQLADLLVDPPYQEAIGVLDMISNNPEDLQFYEARLKFLRDQHSQIEAAEQEGEARGRRIGLEAGREEGREEGMVAGKIQLLQELLGDRIASKLELLAKPLVDLESQLAQLQQRLRNRDA
ncbi:MAG: Rpn family recombination-promoting nuclease/putative transposase [Pirellulaceae bacterium]